jgi:uncharacterized protein (DUF1015 family)
MAEIRAFRGHRYNIKTPDELGALVSPPYDMLNPAFIDALHDSDPRNVIRIIQNRPLASDTENRDRHKRAARLFNQWMEDNTFIQDPTPGAYIYRQTFDANPGGPARIMERTGMTLLVRLEDFSDEVILPHENTLSGPKIDRYELLEESQANTELIFGLVSDDDGKVFDVIRSAAKSPVIGRFTDFCGVKHELIYCCDMEIMSQTVQTIRNRSILIADGHHRYETALDYYQISHLPRAGYVMMTLVSQADPGLLIRPFHRLVKKCALSEKFTSYRDLERFFTCTDCGESVMEGVNLFLDGKTGFEMMFADAGTRRLWGLSTNSAGKKCLEDNADEMSEAWNDLSVSKINRLCVEGIMNQTADGTVLHDVFEYMDNPSTALKSTMEDSGFTGCFFIRPLDIATVRKIVAEGERMPQKSTNFFPKLFSGLVFNRMTI